MVMNDLTEKVSIYVSGFLKKRLSPSLVFHNIKHTYEVVEAVKEIAMHSGFTGDNMEILVIAAWFHDTGYSKVYQGHEEESKNLAEAFLSTQGCSVEIIRTILACISATRFPQFPKSAIEEVLCDADLYHFTRPGYPKYAAAIRSEFEVFLDKVYTDIEWTKINYDMLTAHTYFTKYGRTVLTKFKEVNMSLMND